MGNFINVQQNTDEWQALRMGKATASNFACFMANFGSAFGEPAERYALQLALERLTGKKASAAFSNEHTERGHEQEPVARMLYEEETFSTVTNGGFFDCGDYGDSPDGLIGECGVVEIKSVIAPVHYKTIKRGRFDPAYKWQIVGHLDCTGREWVDFVSYCADFPRDSMLFIDRVHASDVFEELSMLSQRRADFLALVNKTTEAIKASGK